MTGSHSILLKKLKKVSVLVETFDPNTVDDDGGPAYLDARSVEVVARREDSEVLMSDGKRIAAHLTLWILPEQEPIPQFQDRITFEEEPHIGVQTKRVENFQGQVHHYRTRCRRE